jgi:hypothetical protein
MTPRVMKLLVTALLVWSCTTTPATGDDVAARIAARLEVAALPEIGRIEVSPSDLMNGASVTIYLTPAMSRLEAEGYWCSNVLPLIDGWNWSEYDPVTVVMVDATGEADLASVLTPCAEGA